jgi:hypothetical protein
MAIDEAFSMSFPHNDEVFDGCLMVIDGFAVNAIIHKKASTYDIYDWQDSE